MSVQRIDIAEFRERGYLQEINRLMLHPLGLALEVVVEPCSCDGGHIEDGPAGATYSIICPACLGTEKIERLGGVWDYRADPEGIVYAKGTIEQEKIDRVAADLERHQATRERLLGDGRFIQTAEDEL